MSNHVAFDTNKAFRYLIKNTSNADTMRDLHEQYALWREGEPNRFLQKPDPNISVVMFHGEDEGKTRSLADQLITAIGTSKLLRISRTISK